MRILHISNDFAGSKVHSNLTKAIDGIGVSQTVYCPVRDESLLGNNRFEGKNIVFIYSFCIKTWYRLVYHYKLGRLYNDLRQKVELEKYDVIHAATLFSDGGLAYKAHVEYGTRYIVAVRNTDYNDFIRLLPHTYPMGRKVLQSAERIVFISAGIKRQFENSRFVKPILHDIKDKFVIQPNGIDAYWLLHISREKRLGHKILYVGDFSENKNVARLIKAVLKVRTTKGYDDCHLTLVGGGKNRTNEVENLIENHPECVTYLGKIYDKDRLASVMTDCSLFAMPSIHETFGLVYLEALSQNLPVVYTKGQGIDGMFDESVGIAVNPKSVDEIRDALLAIMENPGKYGNGNVDFEKFSWENIAEDYHKIYLSIEK